MSLVGFQAQNHPQQIAKDDVDDRALPPEDFAKLHARFKFTVDAAAASHNAKLPRYWTKERDGLKQSWAGERVYCNPPFSNIKPWVANAHSTNAELVVMLLPANRTEQNWWQTYIEPVRDRGGRLRVEFLPKRMRFLSPGETDIRPNNRPPFGCCLCIWDNTVEFE